MSATHTPGPWHVNFTKFSEVRTDEGALIAKCEKLSGLVNLQANARLIAAAPDLLEALKNLLRANPGDCTIAGRIAETGQPLSAYGMARHAAGQVIAKAQGEEA
jgi:hypothetical protein